MGEENCYARSHDLKLLRIVMVLVGVIFITGIYPLMMPSGWTWLTGHSDSDYPRDSGRISGAALARIFCVDLLRPRTPVRDFGIIRLCISSHPTFDAGLRLVL